jgi:hypothetical protein
MHYKGREILTAKEHQIYDAIYRGKPTMFFCGWFDELVKDNRSNRGVLWSLVRKCVVSVQTTRTEHGARYWVSIQK